MYILFLWLFLFNTAYGQSMTKLLVVGGRPSTSYGNVEVVDLSGQDLNCQFNGGSLNVNVDYGAVGAFVDGRIIVCGGYFVNERKSGCSLFDEAAGNWIEGPSMSQPRIDADSVQFNPDSWWITGGYDNLMLNSSDSFSPSSSSFAPYDNLPEGLYDHSMAAINSTHAVMVGGYTPSDKVYLFNSLDGSWTSDAFPTLPFAMSQTHIGIVTSSIDGSKSIVIAGGVGLDDTLVHELSDMALPWRPAGNLPNKLYLGETVPFGDTFMIVGGYSDGGVDTLLEFDLILDTWTVRTERLSQGKFQSAAFFVPDSFVQCV